MQFKLINFYLIFLLLFSFSGHANDDDKKETYKNITLEQCSIYTGEFQKYFKNRIDLIIKISESELPKVPIMIDDQLTNELKRYRDIFTKCHTKKIFDGHGGEKDKEENLYHVIDRDLFSVIIFMENIKEYGSSDLGLVKVLMSHVKKNYIEIKKALDGKETITE